MILITSPTKPFTYTAKNTPRRQVIIEEYESEIEKLYSAANESSQADELSPPDAWDLISATQFVRTAVDRIVKARVTDTDDLFQKGCDRYASSCLFIVRRLTHCSLQATWIRNSILHAMRESCSFDTRRVPNNLVYQHPTIAALAQYVSSQVGTSIRTNGPVNGRVDTEGTIAAMLSMTEKYRNNFPQHSPCTDKASGEVILVTGTTGSLGCALLSLLLQAPEVEHVYALNRISVEGRALVDRQKDRLREWGFDPAIAHSSKVTLLEADMSTSHLGLSTEVYDQVRNSV